MLNQSFSSKNFSALLNPSDFATFKISKKDKESLTRQTEELSQKVFDGSFQFAPFNTTVRGGKTIYSNSCLWNELVLRKLNDNTKRLYKIKQADRGVIVSQVISLLKETVPMHILKMDIKSFYESINKHALIKKLTEDPLLSHQSKKILEKFFCSPQFASMSIGVED